MAKILVIDDSENSRRLVSRVLSPEHEVFSAESWSKSLKHIYHVDLILLDINMPGMKGDRVAEMIKKVSDSPPIIVFFSSMNESDLRRMAREIGVTGYITKTFDEEVLRVRVAKFLKR